MGWRDSEYFIRKRKQEREEVLILPFFVSKGSILLVRDCVAEQLEEGWLEYVAGTVVNPTEYRAETELRTQGWAVSFTSLTLMICLPARPHQLRIPQPSGRRTCGAFLRKTVKLATLNVLFLSS